MVGKKNVLTNDHYFMMIDHFMIIEFPSENYYKITFINYFMEY